MRYLTAFFCCFFLLTGEAFAERKISLGGLQVHYNAFNTTYLQRNIIEAVGLVYDGKQGVLNITVLKDGQPIAVNISGELRDLLGKKTPLAFHESRYQGSQYYLAQFPLKQREMLRFFIELQEPGGAVQRFEFNQEMFPE